MKLKKINILVLILLMSTAVLAQTESNPWAVGFNLNPKEYQGDLGNSYFKFNMKHLNPGLTVNRYVNSFIDVNVSGNMGDYEYANDTANFNINLLDLGLKGRFKFDNGVIFKEDAKLGPYLTAGAGVLITDVLNKNIAVATVFNVPLGGGIRWKYNDRFNINYELSHNLNFSDALDGVELGDDNDSYLAHQIGFNFTLGEGKEKDSDKDGIADSKDLCPNTPKGLAVTGDGCPKIINEVSLLAKNVYFETASDVLKSESNQYLDQIAEIMKNNKAASLSIEGHTDNIGDASTNLDLSKRRASAVKNYLMGQGVESYRITPQGFGETRPVADNGTEEGRALNRRVEMVITF